MEAKGFLYKSKSCHKYHVNRPLVNVFTGIPEMPGGIQPKSN